MRPVRWLLIYILVVFIGGALLAPWLYFGMQKLAAGFPSLEKLANNPFHRYVNRSLLALAIIGLWPLLRGLGIRNKSELGLNGHGKACRALGAGFGIGFLSLALAAVVFIVAGYREINSSHGVNQLLKHLLNATLAAVAVSFLEEIVFRGVFFGTLRKGISLSGAFLLSSGIYALVHFFAKPAPPSAVTPLTGFIVLGEMLRGFADLDALIPAFINLVVVGLILALAYQRTGSLYLSIGLHAGWIFWLKSFDFFTRPAALMPPGKLLDSWITGGILCVVLFLVSRSKNPMTPSAHAR